MKKEKLALDVVNPQAAGIDVGSRSHYVAIGQGDEDVLTPYKTGQESENRFITVKLGKYDKSKKNSHAKGCSF